MKSLTQKQISKICEELLERLPDFLTHMDIDFMQYPNRIAFPCPVHGGDNPEACCIFTDGNSAKGNWHCWTRHCEEEYSGSLVGLVRGWMEKNGCEENSFHKALKFCCDFLKMDVEKVEESNYDKGRVNQVFKIFNDEKSEIYELIFTNVDYNFKTLSNDLLLEKRLKFLNFDRIEIIAEMFMKLLKDEKSNLYETHDTLIIDFDTYEDYIINVKEYNEIIETCQVFLHSFPFLDGYCIHA